MAANSTKRITIIGTGLIGGSIGLALKSAGLPGVEIVGHDRYRDVASKAEKMGAVDRAEHNLHRAVEGAGMVIIATPVLAVRETLEQIAPTLAEGAVVTDTGSTKAHIMRWAQGLLPDYVSFIGGHPMAGKEEQGLENAEVSLFQGRAYCICPAVDAPESAVKSVLGLAQLIGGQPVFIDPEEHDVYAAAVSHLPLMVSTALFHLLRASPSWPDMSVMAASGFRDMTRLASGDPRMGHDIWVTNRDSLIHWLERMAAELQMLRSLLEDANDEELLDLFAGAKVDRDAFVIGTPTRTPDLSAAESTAEARNVMMDMLVGGMMGDKLRKMRALSESPPSKATPEPDATPAGGYTQKKGSSSLAERIEEGVRRDLEKMERQRAEKDAREQRPRGDA